MKKTELRQIIREEINKIERSMVNEDRLVKTIKLSKNWKIEFFTSMWRYKYRVEVVTTDYKHDYEFFVDNDGSFLDTNFFQKLPKTIQTDVINALNDYLGITDSDKRLKR